ncbi:glyoxalase [Robbsia andropogonis]|uniref:Glyoxalase n=1 Tax=Robbsia andropogonis TaxID=28092 RepID=A0A0F5K4J5_9BURK|nr:VOC family protein [Robbsia andropogonis]KKB64794.1 glyoxalase [Robbsia andropogonis]MCP1117874.1 VOC family protein [Robbsia andropogonis]MCP1127338.1 VOC family protein [Robbsia andropogonis]
MNIIGPDSLVFGVDDVANCNAYLLHYGLLPIRADETGGRFEALDGTAVEIRRADDPTLPPALGTGSMLRKTTYGVADAATLQAIAEELRRDREVKQLADGSIESVDDMGFALGFQITTRKPLALPAEAINAPGAPAQRPTNVVAVNDNADLTPRTLSHVVYFVPDADKAEAFYVERLGFRCSDRFTGVGPFLRPAGTLDHHTLFMIQTPPFMKGCEHFTFHMGGPTAVLQAGTRFVEKGYQSFWGPGRHRFGSNWFWYFNSPLGCHVEYDADMDLHDDEWTARAAPMSADGSQLFLFQHHEKWVPGGPPTKRPE